MRIPVTAHGVAAHELYRWFSTSNDVATHKQKAARICSKENAFHLGNVYYLQSVGQLRAFVAQLKPKGRGDETAAQLKDRFFREHAYLLQALPEDIESANHGGRQLARQACDSTMLFNVRKRLLALCSCLRLPYTELAYTLRWLVGTYCEHSLLLLRLQVKAPRVSLTSTLLMQVRALPRVQAGICSDVYSHIV
jgi:hypothetical protein